MLIDQEKELEPAEKLINAEDLPTTIPEPLFEGDDDASTAELLDPIAAAFAEAAACCQQATARPHGGFRCPTTHAAASRGRGGEQRRRRCFRGGGGFWRGERCLFRMHKPNYLMSTLRRPWPTKPLTDVLWTW